jgi:hypothetical protein
VPESVKQSVECDFLLLAAGVPSFRAVIEQIGLASSFQETHSYFADPVCLATDVLPAGWEARLVRQWDEVGVLRAYCVEIHDTCVNKLMAGREKDFVFIKGDYLLDAPICHATEIPSLFSAAESDKLPDLRQVDNHRLESIHQGKG